MTENSLVERPASVTLICHGRWGWQLANSIEDSAAPDRIVRYVPEPPPPPSPSFAGRWSG